MWEIIDIFLLHRDLTHPEISADPSRGKFQMETCAVFVFSFDVASFYFKELCTKYFRHGKYFGSIVIK